MIELKNGTTLKTINEAVVRVGKKLGEGGQGAVYKVSYNGKGAAKTKALKWYSGGTLKNPAKFYENLENNIKKGSPAPEFLWPEDITEKQTGDDGKLQFGYIMDLRPADYRDFSLFLLAQERFASVNALCNTALHIVAAFRELHNSGYSYQDLNDGNFFVNPKTGDVLICDNDNVAEYGKNLGIAGKCRYIAPEIVLGKELPGIHTDKFSLAVVLFLLLFNNHPLEGAKAYPPCMTEEIEKKIYGSEPVFIFDPDDNSNRPVAGININVINRWPLFPKYVRDLFTRAFSKQAMNDPSYRIIEKEWLKTFIRLRSEIYKCDCGEVFFADAIDTTPCPACGKAHKHEHYLELPRYNIALHRRTRLYPCHTEDDATGNGDDFETLCAETVLNEQTGLYELKNRSKKTWLVILPDGKQVSRGANKTAAIEKGTQIIFGSVTGRII